MGTILVGVDQLGKQMNFNIEGGTYRTSLGGIITIISFIGMMTLIYYFGNDLLYHKSPAFMKTTFKTNHYPFRNMSIADVFVAYRIRGYNQPGINDVRMFEYYFKYKRKTLDNKTKKYTSFTKHYPVHKCKFDSTLHNVSYFYEKLGDFMCVDFSNLEIGGPDHHFNYGKLYYNIKKCDKKTEDKFGVKCYNKEEFSQKLKELDGKLYFETIYKQNEVMPGNFKKPYSAIYQKDYVGIDFDNKNVLYKKIFFSIGEIITDVGIFFPEIKNQSFFEYDKMVEDRETTTEDFLVTLRILLSRKKTSYTRSYIKVQDVLGNAGGFLSIVMSWISYLYSFYLDNAYQVFLYEKLFNLELDAESPEEKKSDKTQNILIMQNVIDVTIHNDKKNNSESNIGFNNKNESSTSEIIQKENFIGNIELRQLTINPDEKMQVNNILFNSDIKKVIEHKNKKRERVSISFSNVIYYSICCFKDNYKSSKKLQIQKFELIEAANSVIDQKHEIVELWKSLDQQRLLEKIVLNENQSYMLHNRDKQDIVTNDQEDLREIMEEKEKRKQASLQDYLKELKNNKNLNDIDKLLVKYVDSDFKTKLNIEI